MYHINNYEREDVFVGKQKKTLQTAISELCLLNDDLMTLVFDRNIEAAELLLNIILQRDDLRVIEVVAQRKYKNPMAGGRSVTLDIYAEDEDGKVYDIEVQRAVSGADVHRARFHSSMIDTKMLKEKQEFRELCDSYVIFITESDVMGAGLSLYHVERMIKETSSAFHDGSHIIYVNGSYQNDEDSVGKLMHDFRCADPNEMFYQDLAKHVKYFKGTEGGQEIMSNAFRELAQELAEELAEEKAEKLAEEKTKEQVIEEKKVLARRMIARGKLTVEEIAEDTELTVDVVKNLAELQLV